MSGKSLIPLIIGLAVGGFALKLVFDTVRKAQAAKPDTVTVWAAREDIPRGTAITESMIQAVKYPPGAVPQGTFQVKEQVLGRVVRTTAPGGLPLLETMLLPAGAKPGLWVKNGFRAVSIKIDESSGVSNLLQPGCFVDVIGYFKVTKDKRNETITRTLIENVEVAAVGERLDVSIGDDGKKKATAPARAVTLFVKPEDVPQLHLAEQRGKLKLSMRNSDDTQGIDGDDTRYESQVVGIEEGSESPAPGSGGNDVLEKVMAMFKERDAKLDALARGQLVSAAGGASFRPPYVMTIWNGDARVELGWTSVDSMEPIQLSHPTNVKRGASADAPAGPAPGNAVAAPPAVNADTVPHRTRPLDPDIDSTDDDLEEENAHEDEGQPD